jgi:hypothetical protein
MGDARQQIEMAMAFLIMMIDVLMLQVQGRTTVVLLTGMAMECQIPRIDAQTNRAMPIITAAHCLTGMKMACQTQKTNAQQWQETLLIRVAQHARHKKKGGICSAPLL